MKNYRVENTITGEVALLCDESEKWVAEKLVATLRRNDATMGKPEADGWIMIEIAEEAPSCNR